MKTCKTILLVAGAWAVCMGTRAASAQTSDAQTHPAGLKTQWRLPDGTPVSRTGSFDVSADRAWAAGAGKQAGDYCWLLNLRSGEIEGLLPKLGVADANAPKGKGAASVEFSPDGRRLLWQRYGQVGAVMLDLSTRAAVPIAKAPMSSFLWSGNRMIVREPNGPIQAFDAGGKPAGKLAIDADVKRSDAAGEKLLALTEVRDANSKDPDGALTMAVMTPQGKTLKVIGPYGDRVCPWGPWFSHQGAYACVFYNDPNDGWVTRLFATGGKETITLTPLGYGGVQAVTDTGEGIRMEDEGRDSTETLEYWNRDGIRRKLAPRVRAGTIRGEEIFYIQEDGNSLVLKAVEFPRAAPATAPTP
jgi:hypothetical protein